MNIAILRGNVGNDPEVRTVGSGTRIAKCSFATNRRFNDRSGQRREETEWHRLIFWDRLAEVVERYVQKGDSLLVRGRIHYSTSEDDRGQPRYWTEIVVDEMEMLGSGRGGGRQPGQDDDYEAPSPRARRAPAPAPSPASPFDADDDDLPF